MLIGEEQINSTAKQMFCRSRLSFQTGSTEAALAVGFALNVVEAELSDQEFAQK